MPPDIVDFLRPSPYDAVKYYLRKSGRDPISRTSNILNDPAVRLYTSTLVRVTLCFKYWDADWRQIVPVRLRHLPACTHHTAHTFLRPHLPPHTSYSPSRHTIPADVRQSTNPVRRRWGRTVVLSAPSLPALTRSRLLRMGKMTTVSEQTPEMQLTPATVGLLLKRLPYISGPFNDPSNVLSPGDAQALVEACSKDLENAQPKKGIKYFTDKKLGRTPPPGTKLKTVQPQPEKMTATSQPSTTPCHPSATTFQTPAASQRAGILTQPAASPWPPTLSTQATVPSISTPTLGPPLGPSISSTTMSLRSTSTTGASTSDQHILAKMKAQKQAVRNAHRRIFNTPLLGFGIRFQSIHQAASARPAALMHSRPEQEWRCPNCGFKNPEPIHPSEEPVKNDTSEIKEKVEETATCSNCKELRGKSDVPTTGTGDRACPECQEFLPEGIPERARVYSSELLKAHVIDWHSDYAIAVAWCTQQEVVSAGATIWACPSMRCPWT